MDINLLRVAMTVVSFAVFLGVIVWAVHPRNKARFEEAARLPLEEDVTRPPPQPSPRGEGANVVEVFVTRPPPQPSPRGEGANVVEVFANRERG